MPALEAARFDLNDSLKEGGKNLGGGARSHRLRNLFVVMQVAMALVLLVGAGLFMKSLSRLRAVDPGFNASNLLTMRVSLPGRKYDNDQKVMNFFNQASEQLRALPGVQAVGAINTLPFAGPHSGTSLEVEGQPAAAAGSEVEYRHLRHGRQLFSGHADSAQERTPVHRAGGEGNAARCGRERDFRAKEFRRARIRSASASRST